MEGRGATPAAARLMAAADSARRRQIGTGRLRQTHRSRRRWPDKQETWQRPGRPGGGGGGGGPTAAISRGPGRPAGSVNKKEPPPNRCDVRRRISPSEDARCGEQAAAHNKWAAAASRRLF